MELSLEERLEIAQGQLKTYLKEEYGYKIQHLVHTELGNTEALTAMNTHLVRVKRAVLKMQSIVTHLNKEIDNARIAAAALAVNDTAPDPTD